jgi:hypothetical protein
MRFRLSLQPFFAPASGKAEAVPFPQPRYSTGLVRLGWRRVERAAEAAAGLGKRTGFGEGSGMDGLRSQTVSHEHCRVFWVSEAGVQSVSPGGGSIRDAN